MVTAEPPVFSAGGSLDDLLNPRAPLEEMYAGFEAIAAAPVPTIAAVEVPRSAPASTWPWPAT